jgi:L-lactate dehydrogenase (cytochrome)
MYSLAFGDEGVNQVAMILRDELAQNVRLVGSTKLSQLDRSIVNAKELERDLYDGPYDSPVKTILAKL